MNKTRKSHYSFLLVALSLLSNSAYAELSPARVELVRHGKPQAVSSFHEGKLVLGVEALLASSSVNASPTSTASKDWKKLAQDSYILLDYYQRRHIDLLTSNNRNKKNFSVDQILLPLPTDALPGFILIREGKDIHSFSKYNPNLLCQIARNEITMLKGLAPYRELCRP